MHSASTDTVLVVGASSGFGAGVATVLLERGYTVYAAGRRLDRMQTLAARGAQVLRMDVTDAASVDAGVERIIAAQGRLDHVYANAGYGSYGMIESVSLEEIRRQYDVNVFGVGRVVQAVLPHMRSQRRGRIIITASVASHVAIAGMGWYASTKHALDGVATALRQEVAHLGIDVVVIEPGMVQTEFDSVALDTLKKTDHPEAYHRLVTGFRRFMEAGYARGPGPERTVAAMVHAATARRPRRVYRTTMDARTLPWLRTLLGGRLFYGIYLAWARRLAESGR